MKKFKNLSKLAKISVIAIILIVIASSAYAYRSINDKNKNPDSEGANTSAPTEEEKQQAEDHKKEIDKRSEVENQASDQSGQKRQVSVVITNANVSGIYSYVSGVFEDGGTCTALITKGSAQITKTSSSFKDASHTSCAPINLTRADFPSAGTWSVKVNYSSATSEGQSQSVNIEVQ